MTSTGIQNKKQSSEQGCATNFNLFVRVLLQEQVIVLVVVFCSLNNVQSLRIQDFYKRSLLCYSHTPGSMLVRVAYLAFALISLLGRAATGGGGLNCSPTGLCIYVLSSSSIFSLGGLMPPKLRFFPCKNGIDQESNLV